MSTKVKVEIYTQNDCPHCERAKALLEREGVSFTEFNVTEQPFRGPEFALRTRNAKTRPQIFVRGKLIGGADALEAFAAAGGLVSLKD